MPATVHINGIPYTAIVGELLSSLLVRQGYAVEHPCGGRGTCKKCTVLVNGAPALSCQTVIEGDMDVRLTAPDAIQSAVYANGTGCASAWDAAVQADMGRGVTLVLDIGTTTLAAAPLHANGELARIATANNPQRAFGADVMSRIAYAGAHGAEAMTRVLREAVNGLFDELSVAMVDRLYVAGNTTMLHLLLGVDPTPMGVAPYTPAFLAAQTLGGDACGLPRVAIVETLPSIAAFVGADLVAGLNLVGLPAAGKYRLLVDLGTNAEILLIGHEGILCTAAAAGPCFEGASISCGMSATPGAITAYDPDGAYTTVADAPPRGLCGTGLVDVVAALLATGVVDETGYMEPEPFFLADGVSLTQADIRQYQLAKSAVCAAIETLIRRAGIDYGAIDRLCIAGGFAATVNVESAARTGLLPAPLADRCTPVGNSSLLGTARYAHAGVSCEGGDLAALIANAAYIDLAADPYFTERFMEGMMFGDES